MYWKVVLLLFLFHSQFSILHSFLSLTGKRWLLPLRQDAYDAQTLLLTLSQARSIDLHTNAFDTSWYDPKRFPDSAKAVDRVTKAMHDKETIGIFGDYDCDGITASAQMLRMFRRRGIEPILRLPHRVHDGYGLKSGHIDEFKDQGISLLITVDTGIAAHEAIDRANECGIDVIILDHHTVTTPPNAFAILHPAIAPGFAQPHPSAAGVAFSFAHAMEGEHWDDRDTDLALAMLGTVADLVPLIGANRRLVQEGLDALHRLQGTPLAILRDNVSSGNPLTSVDVAFRIAPRINAAGRMAAPMLGLRAILEGGELLKDLDTLNSLRQSETARALDKALLDIARDATGNLPAFLSISSSQFPPGIVGLLAGKLTDRFGRPSMAISIQRELCTASLRSPPHYNITQALQRIAPLLQSFGGHAQAAGATFSLENAMAVMEALERDAEAHIAGELHTPTIGIDAIVPHASITTELCTSLRSLEPFGQGNPEPLFLVENVTMESVRQVGADSKHLQARIGQCKLIGFGIGELAKHSAQPLDIVGKLGIDAWNGRMSPQLMIQDMRISSFASIGGSSVRKKN